MSDKKADLSFIRIVVITVVYIAIVFLLSISSLSQKPLAPNELGDFLAGAFSPLALMWLIYGYYQQKIELQQNTKALNLQHQELINSVEQQRNLSETTQSELVHFKTQSELELGRLTINAQPFIHFDIQSITKYDLNKQGGLLVIHSQYNQFQALSFSINLKNSRAIARELCIIVTCNTTHIHTQEIPILDSLDETWKSLTFIFKKPLEHFIDNKKCTLELQITYLDNFDLVQQQSFVILLTNNANKASISHEIKRVSTTFKQFSSNQ